jgi:succinate dehydrogenase flavin-adding protein (antitoxin of CptAB toxin-antitoxin module)
LTGVEADLLNFRKILNEPDQSFNVWAINCFQPQPPEDPPMDKATSISKLAASENSQGKINYEKVAI